MTDVVAPLELSETAALNLIRDIAADTDRIVVVPYGSRRMALRKITRRQVELCCQRGTIAEGPFVNSHGLWQVNLYRHAAGEEVTCVVAIEWATRLLVINAFEPREKKSSRR